jgi:hypothetical protein
VEDYALSPHFSFFELTHTDNAGLQEQNRVEGQELVSSLVEVANMLEAIRRIVGPLHINSGFRCPELNGATPGSSKKSQHMKGEAADFHLAGVEPTPESMDALFDAVLEACVDNDVQFGQLIRETAKRSSGTSDWVHVSLGAPYRDEEKCGQVMRMKDGVYTLIKTVKI